MNDELIALIARLRAAPFPASTLGSEAADEIGSLAARLSAALLERDEADRRAGAAERNVEYQSEKIAARERWLHDAKAAWGVDDRVSFDVVWKEALALKAAAVERQEIKS